MRIHQRKKRNEALYQQPVEPNEQLGDGKPQLICDAIEAAKTVARKTNRAQAFDRMKLRPAMQKAPLRTAPYMRARHYIVQPRPGF